MATKKFHPRTLLSVVNHPRLCKALDAYFAAKAAGKGIFPSSEEKERLIDEIFAAAHALNMRCSVVPGAVCLTKKTKIAWITKQDYEPSKWEAKLEP